MSARLRFWLAALDFVHWCGAPQGSRLYLWVLRRASNAWEPTGDEVLVLRDEDRL